MNKLRKQIYEIIEPSEKQQGLSGYVDLFLITIIILNAFAIILESIEGLNNYGLFFQGFEFFSIVIFSIEYFLRIWTAVEKEKFQSKVKGRIKYALTPMAIIDLLAILPFFLSLYIDLRAIRVFRIFRLLRIFKVLRYYTALQEMEYVIKSKKEQLFVSIIFLVFILFIVSTIMYFIENEAQPEAFSSIPQTMWWGISTLTTVGYGDVYPVTPLGRLMGGAVSILGIGLFALPTGILASGFAEILDKKKNRPKGKDICPYCGHKTENNKDD